MKDQPVIGLLVEDLLFRSKIETTAAQLKINTVAWTGDFAMAQNLESSLTLMILDLHHKKIDPIQWLKEWKQNPATANIPVLGFFSHVEIQRKRQAVEAGCNMVVPRSVFSAQLPELLARYVKVRLPNPTSPKNGDMTRFSFINRDRVPVFRDPAKP